MPFPPSPSPPPSTSLFPSPSLPSLHSLYQAYSTLVYFSSNLFSSTLHVPHANPCSTLQTDTSTLPSPPFLSSTHHSRHTYIHTYIHIYIYTYLHTYILTYTHKHIHTEIYTLLILFSSHSSITCCLHTTSRTVLHLLLLLLLLTPHPSYSNTTIYSHTTPHNFSTSPRPWLPVQQMPPHLPHPTLQPRIMSSNISPQTSTPRQM